MLAAPQERARAAMMRPHDVLGVRADASQAEVWPRSGPYRRLQAGGRTTAHARRAAAGTR